ncbi:hypothetical protein AK812_SmicGene32172 [Symbiodinium microadriaticum]|uniref:Uncharacterized protein n=1 Tax=Symbiodinium microadriaticum TaxID=2951 RepID=A0A1Q9CUW0_SYMMI|nr:hypothetical protein AK812_SmicGene32172 [Symbiodinium microadriaticum]
MSVYKQLNHSSGGFLCLRHAFAERDPSIMTGLVALGLSFLLLAWLGPPISVDEITRLVSTLAVQHQG